MDPEDALPAAASDVQASGDACRRAQDGTHCKEARQQLEEHAMGRCRSRALLQAERPASH